MAKSEVSPLSRFSKAYVEITNICNLRCSFCHGTKRAPRMMSADEFAVVAEKLRGYTEHIYFHLLGEPLLHPELRRMLSVAAEKGFKCCITTNGFLIKECADTLLGADSLYKLSVSLHSFEANEQNVSLRDYLEDVWAVCQKLSDRGTICALRLWNDGGKAALNDEIYAFLREKTGRSDWPETRRGSRNLCGSINLENAAKFDWPDINAPEYDVQFCRGLRDQIAVLCDGTVVPCCLDADGKIALGNIFAEELSDILSSPRAKAVYNGFSNRRPSEDLCRKCGYATRFNK